MSPARTEELRARLKALCPMRQRAVTIAEVPFTIQTACNLDPLLEALAQKNPDHPDVLDERLPYWAELWPSAQALAEAILTLPPPNPGPWLELGCGPGLPGLAARSQGIPGVASDYIPESLWLAELNAHLNGFQQANTLLLDWRSPPLQTRFPWILASDVAYEARNFSPLLNVFDQLLSPGGEIWLSEPGRPVTTPFWSHLRNANWSASRILQRQPVSVHRLQRFIND